MLFSIDDDGDDDDAIADHSILQLEGLIKATGVVPAVNQIERHPRLTQPELIAYAKEKNIHITAYSVSGSFSDLVALSSCTYSDKGLR